MKMGTRRVCSVWWILGRMGKKNWAEMFSPQNGEKIGWACTWVEIFLFFFFFHFFSSSNVASFFFF